MTSKSQRAELENIVGGGIDSVLLPADFVREDRLRWRRRTSELEHVLEVLQRRGTYDVQWGVVSPEVIRLVWGTEPRGDVGDAAMTGSPSSIQHPAKAQSFRLDLPDDATVIATDVAEDIRIVERWLRPFQTRADLRRYLLLNRDRKDNREFLVPANLPLKLYVAAALAVIDRAADACGLVEEASAELAAFGDAINNARLAALHEAAKGLC